VVVVLAGTAAADPVQRRMPSVDEVALLPRARILQTSDMSAEDDFDLLVGPYRHTDRVPGIETERLWLKPLSVDDLDPWHRQIFSDPDVTRFLPVRKPIPKEDAVQRLASQVESWQARGFGVWAVREKASNQLVGHSGFVTSDRIELIYALGRGRWGRGFATEAAAACLRHGFEVLDFTEIAALSFPENEPSIRVMLKLGFVFEDIVPRFGVELVRYKADADSFWASSHARAGVTSV
jgi:ribosomal-protein-alanine N-acetyltransferase